MTKGNIYMSVNPAENRAILGEEYVQLNDKSVIVEQKAKAAKAALATARLELQRRIAGGVTNPNDTSFLSPFLQQSAKSDTEAFLIGSFAEYKGQEYIDACLRCIG